MTVFCCNFYFCCCISLLVCFVCIANLYVYNYVVISCVVLCMLCTQGSAENQLCAERTPCLNITITITITGMLVLAGSCMIKFVIMLSSY